MTDDALIAGLRNAVSCELHAQLALRGDSIELADVAGVAYAVAVQLDRQFDIVAVQDAPADDDSLSLDCATFHSSTLAPTERYPIFDHGWPTRR